MKKYFILLLVMLPLWASAQIKITEKCPLLNKVKSFSFTEANQFADEITLVKTKKLFKENFSMSIKYSIIYYSDDYDRRKSSIRFEFIKVKENENRAAGIVGSGVYKLASITGGWEEIYSIWSELMQCCGENPDGKELIEKTKRSTFTAIATDKKVYKFYLQKVSIDWKIDITEE